MIKTVTNMACSIFIMQLKGLINQQKRHTKAARIIFFLPCVLCVNILNFISMSLKLRLKEQLK